MLQYNKIIRLVKHTHTQKKKKSSLFGFGYMLWLMFNKAGISDRVVCKRYCTNYNSSHQPFFHLSTYYKLVVEFKSKFSSKTKQQILNHKFLILSYQKVVKVF